METKALMTLDLNSPDIVKTIRDTVAKEANETEFALFMLRARATGLNPLANEIWFVKTKGYTSRDGRQVEGKMQIMIGINGYLVRADRRAEFDGMDVESAFDKDGKLMSSTAKVYRKDRSRAHVATVFFSEYYRQGFGGKESTWDKMPVTMLEKVAMAHALRLAFPGDFSGTYIPEEAPAEEPTVTVTPIVSRLERAVQSGNEYEQRQATKARIEGPKAELEVTPEAEGPFLYAIPEPTADQRVFLEKHAEYDEMMQVWHSKKALGAKLEKYRTSFAAIENTMEAK